MKQPRTRNRNRVAAALEAGSLAEMQRALGTRPGALRPQTHRRRFRPEVAESARMPAAIAVQRGRADRALRAISWLWWGA